MYKVWLLILAGVVIFPIISGAIKELEERLHKNESADLQSELTADSKAAIEKKIRLLSVLVITAFIVVAILMIYFSRNVSIK